MPRLLLVLLVLPVLLAACRRSDTPEAGFMDDLERPVAVEGPIRSIVSLAPSMTEVAFAAGAGHLVAGVTTVDNYPPEVASLPRFSSWNLNLEAVAALEPDLALASDQVNSLRDGERLEALGIPVAFFSIASLEDVMQVILRVGALLDTEERAQQSVDSLRQRVRDLERLTAEIEERPSVLFLVSADGLNAFGRESYIHDLIRLAGGESATGDLDTAAPVLSEEAVLARPPDVIIGSWEPSFGAADLAALHPSWADLPVIREGRVYGVPADLFLRPGPRLVAGAWHLASVLHPGLVAAADVPETATAE